MVWPIVKKGNPVLEKRCDEVFRDFPKEELDELKKTMDDNRGVGLAANQIGKSERFFVANIHGRFGIFINPVILNHGKEEIEENEGCLSILGKDGKSIFKPKKRFAVITVRYWDRQKALIQETLKRFDARIFQHEMDHLDGRLCQ